MNIDQVEKLVKFPSFLGYVKVNFINAFEWIILIFAMTTYFFSLLTAFIFILIFSIIEYSIDKKIFKAFSLRRFKNDSN